MDTPSKLIFASLLLGLLALCIGTIVAADDPGQWALDVVEVPARNAQDVTLTEYSANYRTISANVEAWTENVAFASRPIQPQDWMVYIYWVAMVFGWALVMTASTYIRNWVAFVLYLPFALFLLTGQVLSGVVDENLGILVSGGQLLLVLIPAFVLHQGYIKLKFALRVLLFVVTLGLPYLIVDNLAGWQGLHTAATDSYFVGLFLTLVVVFFTANDLNNLVFYLATNAKKKKYRAKPPVLLGVFIVMIGLQFMMLQDAMGWNLVELPSDFPFRPIHLVAFSALIMAGTKQNMYPVLKNFLNNRAMSFGFLGAAIIGISFIFFHIAVGEYLFLYTLERLAIILIFLTSVFHMFYVYFNFSSLLNRRVNFYYISMSPRRLMYVFVVLATFLVGFALEASRGFTSRKTFSSTFYNRLADVQMIASDAEQAAVLYETAIGVAEGTVKGNYNLGMLVWTGNGTKDVARNYLRRAGRYIDFPYGFLNLGQLELEEGLVEQAKYYLKKGLEKNKSPYLYNNLAQMHLILGEPDSAIVELKNALLLDDDNSALYGNLGKVYMDFDRIEEAAEFYRAGLEVAEPSPLTVTNALYLDLAYGAGINVSDSLVRLPGVREHLPAWFNLAIDRFRKGEYAEARSVIDSLEAQLDRSLPDSLKGTYRPPEVQFLDGCIMFEEGEYLKSISRMQALDVDYPEFKPYTMRFLGAAYHGKGIPEMAAEFFRRSQQNGNTDDSFYEGLMEIDRGNQEYGYQLLVQARSKDKVWFDPVSKEEAMLQYARGEYFMASLGYDLSKLTRAEWTRTGIYAGKIGQTGPALEAFRKLIAMDSNTVVPYLEMGRISIELEDSLAIENLAAGLEIDPQNVALKAELARAYLQQGDVEKARSYAKDVPATGEFAEMAALLQAEFDLAEGDTAQAIAGFQKIYAQNPLNKLAVVELSKIWRAQREDFEAHDLLMAARQLNSRESEFEYQLAYVEQLLGRIVESAAAAERAMAFEPDSLRSAAIGEEFSRIFELRDLGEEAILQEFYNVDE